MRTMKLVVMAACVALLMTAPAFAQDHSCVKGALEIGGMVSFDRSSFKVKDADEAFLKTTDFTIAPSVGKFFSDNLEVEIMPFIMIDKVSTPSFSLSTQDDFSATNTSFGGVVRGAWHFVGEGSMVPYVAVGIGMATFSTSYSDDTPEPDYKTALLLPEVAAGVKAFLSERVALKAEAFFDLTSNAGGGEDVTNTEFGVRAGIAAFHIM